ncbi:hypothetical protein BU25DRAFT_105625 [Macroventuria anomochaeta]|uniref:Uncharacterized protein n=1 Tax=Macroventuria anomochaeta TaxID=301207 RepID=A0ACB6RV44_9PLEO|nr:uncharacterized protein BU25DRAFT_105625 [Macroventuria anomochaeta]KAF2625911.1 hypothetical protein BU25DRAFT_105625 [Macroventuria anomochaeta]
MCSGPLQNFRHRRLRHHGPGTPAYTVLMAQCCVHLSALSRSHCAASDNDATHLRCHCGSAVQRASTAPSYRTLGRRGTCMKSQESGLESRAASCRSRGFAQCTCKLTRRLERITSVEICLIRCSSDSGISRRLSPRLHALREPLDNFDGPRGAQVEHFFCRGLVDGCEWLSARHLESWDSYKVLTF